MNDSWCLPRSGRNEETYQWCKKWTKGEMLCHCLSAWSFIEEREKKRVTEMIKYGRTCPTSTARIRCHFIGNGDGYERTSEYLEGFAICEKMILSSWMVSRLVPSSRSQVIPMPSAKPIGSLWISIARLLSKNKYPPFPNASCGRHFSNHNHKFDQKLLKFQNQKNKAENYIEKKNLSKKRQKDRKIQMYSK